MCVLQSKPDFRVFQTILDVQNADGDQISVKPGNEYLIL